MTFMVTVGDTTRPAAPRLTVNPGVLWPPNNQMVTVRVTAATTDAVDRAPVCQIPNIASTDNDSRDRGVDFMITGPLTAILRAEKADDKDDKKDEDKEALIYTLTVSCKDATGNAGLSSSITVIVPHDRGK